MRIIGAAQTTNALAGDIDLVFASTVETLSHARDGRARILAVDGLPHPATRGTGRGRDRAGVHRQTGSRWRRRSLPQAILTRLSVELAALRDDADFRARFATLGAEPLMSAPDILAARLAEDVPTWRRVAVEAGIRAE